VRTAAARRVASVSATCLSVALACCSESSASNNRSLRERTLAVLGHARPFDARFTAADVYWTCEPVHVDRLIPPISCSSRPDSTALSLASAVSVDIAGSLGRGPTTDALWSAALLDLWSAHGEPRTIDRVIGRLSEVYARDTTNAMVLNDLALAHLALAADREDARSLFAAVDFAERAYSRDSVSPVVRFNRAVVLERARLDSMAILAWDGVAAAGTDGWADEARERKGRLAAQRATRVSSAAMDTTLERRVDVIRDIVRRDPQTAREYVLDTLVRRWSRATLAGEQAAASTVVQHAAIIGRELNVLTGDSSIVHVSREMEHAQTGSASVPSIAGALAEAADGATDYRRAQYVDAEPKLRSAAQHLERLGAPMLADWTSLLLGAVAVQRSRYQVAEPLYERIASAARTRHAIALEARALWGLSFSRARRGATDESERTGAAAIAAFDHLGETSNAGFMRALVADIHHALGRSGEHARAMYAALDALHRRNDPAFRFPVLLALGQRLADDGVESAAVAAIREAVAIAPGTGRASDVPESLERLGYQQARLGNAADATKTIALVRSIRTSVHDSLMRTRLDGEMARAEAVIYRRRDPQRARERLDVVTTYFARMGIPTDVGPALISRADVRLALGDSAGALADLDSATAIGATLVSQRSDRATVRRLVATQSDVFRRLVAISLARGDTVRAYRYTDLSRADAVVARDENPRHRWVVGRGEVMLDYLLLDDRLLIWTLRGDMPEPTLISVRTTPGEIDALVTRFVNLVRRDADRQAETQVARRLYDLLILPAEQILGDAHRLVLVADRGIADVPFAALRDPDGRYLIERVALAYARRVSATRVVRPVRPSAALRTLLVGNPALDRALFPDLDPLQSADSEIAAIAALRARSNVMTGAGSTRDAFLRELPRHDLVHFAGHAQVVRDEPARSHLVMARDSSGFAHNVVFASDIERLDLRGVRLAILSACGEAGDRDGSGRASNGLVEALLDAGVGQVIASQWEADDRGTADLMVALHKELLAGASADDALQRAQVAIAKQSPVTGESRSSARVWAAFRFYVN
jgi:CHAT domain-containing protein/tetratricopeptide (TPR) repeat protein